MLDTLLELDRSLLLFFNQGHTLYWDQVMWIYTGKLVWIPLILSMIYVAFRCGGWREGVWFVLVVAAGYAQDLCNLEVYDSYLGAYAMKCDANCEEYKK